MQRGALFKMALDIFDGDGSVVNKNADGKREAAKRHDVDGLMQKAEHDHRRQDGERDGDGDDEGTAPASEEEKNHQAGERGSNHSFADNAVDGALHKD